MFCICNLINQFCGIQKGKKDIIKKKERKHQRMYKYQEEVMSSWDATKLYRQGKMSKEELEHIRHINRLKSNHTPKREMSNKLAYEKFRNREDYQVKISQYNKNYYDQNREKILEQKKQQKIERKKKENTI